MARDAQAYLREAADTLSQFEAQGVEDVVAAAELLLVAVGGGGKILICGNGGSAADAQHLATEFVSTLTIENLRPSIPAIALTTNTSLLTAISNDFGVEAVFARQLESLAQAGDVLIAISTSGNSANVVRAAEQARGQDVRVLALTGASGGNLAALADVAIMIPSTVTAHIQECHLAIEHLLALLVERELFNRDTSSVG